MTGSANHFERLGLPVGFAVSAVEIERNYLARSRAVHPDFHQMASVSEQRVSMELTAALNEAYATLRHPFRRAEYLMGLYHGPTASEHKEMAPAFLEEMLELRMEIEEIREAGPESPGRTAMEQQLTKRQEGLVKELSANFIRLEALQQEAVRQREFLLKIRQILNAARYIQGLLRDLRADD